MANAWAITAYFNPLHSRTKYRNYLTFFRNLQQQGVPLLTVECVLEGEQPELTGEDANVLEVRRSASVLWQKERLLNCAVSLLPAECTVVAILDCDLIFENDHWLLEAEKALDEAVAVQGFQYLIRLDKGVAPKNSEQFPVGTNDMERVPSFGFALEEHREEFLTQGTVPGIRFGAWVFQKSFLEQLPLYEKMVLGGFDHVMIHGFFPEHDTVQTAQTMIPYPLPGLEGWVQELGERVQGRVCYVPGVCFHLFHGRAQYRRYGNRYRAALIAAFDPNRDLCINQSGMLELRNPNSALARYLRRHFWLRNEDDSPLIGFLCWCYVRLEGLNYRWRALLHKLNQTSPEHQ